MRSEDNNGEKQAKTKVRLSAFDAAGKYLSASPRSEKEVRDRLYKKGYHKPEVEDALALCKRYGYIDDVRYVSEYAEYYGAKMGKKMMEFKLVAEKGVPREIVAEALPEALSDDEEAENAFRLANKYAATKHLTERKELAKVGAYLWQRGFSRDVIDHALNRLEDAINEYPCEEQDDEES